jgi:transcriptional regulator of acetoin/glycerol metabolism
VSGWTLRNSDRDLIKRTLSEHAGNVSAAAKALGVSRGLIYRRLRRLGNDEG